jgi:hypothetical protein
MPDKRRVVKARRNPHSALVAAGLPPSEAAATLRVVTERLRGVPDDDTPFSALEMQLFATFTEADIETMRVDWYESRAVPLWAKRILDARE